MTFLKGAFLGGLSFLGLPKEQAVVLMYHSVDPDTDYFMNVHPAEFERQMTYLTEARIPVVSLGELSRRLKGAESLGGAVAITFDDGYRDNHTNAFPVLTKHGFPATMFVTTGLVGATDERGLPRLSVAEMQEMEESGLIDIEPHTKSHPKLAEISPAAAREEVFVSKDFVEKVLKKRCAHFAYPFGSHDDAVADIVREAGFEAAFTVREGLVRPGSDVFRIPRVSVDASTSFAQFRGKVSRAVSLYEALKLAPQL